MAINKESNAYTITFSIIMCVVVGTVLAVASQVLKPYQEKNIENDKKVSILAAIGVESNISTSADLYKKYVTAGLVLDNKGNVTSEKLEDAFAVDVLTQYKELSAGAIDSADVKYPLYLCEKDGKKLIVMPVVGMGLWAAIWGYVSVGEDYNTVVGASFAHKSETPGLGAEIATPFFTNQFPGKKLHNETGSFISIKVIKPGSEAKTDHIVDGISGGTFTSQGVDEMLRRCMKVYSIYFQTLKN